MENTIILRQEEAWHAAGRTALLDRVMGRERFTKVSERLRRNRQPDPRLCRIALVGNRLAGTVRQWRVCAEGLDNALLLGPLAVDRTVQAVGIGTALMEDSIRIARDLRYDAIILVGDPDYYTRFGFCPAAPGTLAMPGPFDPGRLLALELQPGGLDRAGGILRPCADSTTQGPSSVLAAAA